MVASMTKAERKAVEMSDAMVVKMLPRREKRPKMPTRISTAVKTIARMKSVESHFEALDWYHVNVSFNCCPRNWGAKASLRPHTARGSNQKCRSRGVQ